MTSREFAKDAPESCGCAVVVVMLLFSACPKAARRAEGPALSIFCRTRECPQPTADHSNSRAKSRAESGAKSYEVQFMKSSYNGLSVPHDGEAIQFVGGNFRIPDRPIIPYIEGDGTGRDIWKASQRVFDAAVEHAYGGKRRMVWFEVFAGEKAYNKFQEWGPQGTVAAARDVRIPIKGPLTTPVGGGIRSLNVALRQILDLYACVRPVRYF